MLLSFVPVPAAFALMRHLSIPFAQPHNDPPATFALAAVPSSGVGGVAPLCQRFGRRTTPVPQFGKHRRPEDDRLKRQVLSSGYPRAACRMTADMAQANRTDERSTRWQDRGEVRRAWPPATHRPRPAELPPLRVPAALPPVVWDLDHAGPRPRTIAL